MKSNMKRINTGQYYCTNNKIYNLYFVRMILDNGSIKDFPSEEHANAWWEDREPKFIPFKTP